MLQLHYTSHTHIVSFIDPDIDSPQSGEINALGREIIDNPCSGIVLLGQCENSSDAWMVGNAMYMSVRP